jgi:hypothetical protein
LASTDPSGCARRRCPVDTHFIYGAEGVEQESEVRCRDSRDYRNNVGRRLGMTLDNRDADALRHIGHTDHESGKRGQNQRGEHNGARYDPN